MLAQVLARKEIKEVAAARAYNRDAIHALIVAANKEAVIPPRSHWVNPPDYDQRKYQQRNQVRAALNRLKHFRAIATRYDKPASMFLGGASSLSRSPFPSREQL